MTASAVSTKTLARQQQPIAALSAENRYILNCLIAGFAIGQIARSMNVSDSAVSQAISAAGLQDLAVATRVQRQQQASETDDLIGKIENKALKQLDVVIGMMNDPIKLARTAQLLNGMKRRSQLEERQGGQDAGRVATIIMPVQIVQSHFTFNERNQAVEIDGRTLVATTGDALMQELASAPVALPRSEDLQRPPQEYNPHVSNKESARTETGGRAVAFASTGLKRNPPADPAECIADVL